MWTNTCCSHQLHGYRPSEIDDEASVSNGSVWGTKAAAIRKLEHELGIDKHAMNLVDFKYLTRLHYSAPCALPSPDTESSISAAGHEGFVQWGETEMDYILFVQKQVTLTPNPEEVAEVKFVTQGTSLPSQPPALLFFTVFLRPTPLAFDPLYPCS